MQEGNAARRAGSEMRLLAITIVVSVLMLFLLARLRFPQEREHPAEAPAAPPLQRLAARATYDELASILRGLTFIVAAEFPSWGTRIQTLMLALIALHQLAGPVLFRTALARAGEAGRLDGDRA